MLVKRFLDRATLLLRGGASGPEGIAKFGLATGAEASKASPNACRLTSGPDLEVQSCKDLQN